MSVLEAPQTWIAAAAVLVVAAVVLIALAPRRRSGSETAAPDDTARRPSDEALTVPVSREAALRPDDGRSDDGPWADDATTTTTATDATTTTTATTTATSAATTSTTGGPWADEEADTSVTAAAAAPTPTGAPRPGASAGTVPVAAPVPLAERPSRITRRYQPVTDPARADDRAKDRLLAVLLADPAAAVDVVAAIPEPGAGDASGASAAALLRAGLRPDQVAALCGVDEGDLGELVARDLGLLERPVGDGQTGRSRTDEPGRAWASAASAPRSTTPTTG